MSQIATTETLGSLASRQAFVTGSLASALELYGPTQEIVSYVDVNPWGRFLIGWEILTDDGGVLAAGGPAEIGR